MKVSHQSQLSESHFSDRNLLYSRIALSIKSSRRLFLDFVDIVCNKIALFISLNHFIVCFRGINGLWSQFIPLINDVGILAIRLVMK